MHLPGPEPFHPGTLIPSRSAPPAGEEKWVYVKAHVGPHHPHPHPHLTPSRQALPAPSIFLLPKFKVPLSLLGNPQSRVSCVVAAWNEDSELHKGFELKISHVGDTFPAAFFLSEL